MTNPIYWPGTTIVRSTCNAFCLSPEARVDTAALQKTENLRAGSAKGVMTRQERKTARGPQVDGKSAKLRALLVNGPMSTAQLAAASGISNKIVPALLQHDLRYKNVVQLREARPYRYALKAGA